MYLDGKIDRLADRTPHNVLIAFVLLGIKYSKYSIWESLYK